MYYHKLIYRVSNILIYINNLYLQFKCFLKMKIINMEIINKSISVVCTFYVDYFNYYYDL